MQIKNTAIRKADKRGSYDVQHDILLLHCNVGEVITQIRCFAYLLSDSETATYHQYHKAEDAANFITGRVLVRLLLSRLNNCLPEDIVILPGKYNKPVALHRYTRALEISCFNISHHANVVVIAIARVPVGIDIEMIDDTDYTCMIKDTCTAKEIVFLQQGTFPAELFLRLWTRKEAVLKCIGTGLIDDLKLLQLCEEVNYFSYNDPDISCCFIHDFTVFHNYAACICYASDKQMQVYFSDVNKLLESNS